MADLPFQKVYLVTSGEYSDYHIAAVFSTEAAAKNFVDTANSAGDYDRYEIEEFNLDAWPDEYPQKAFQVTLHDDGKGESMHCSCDRPKGWRGNGDYSPHNGAAYGWSPKSYSHAFKLAVEAKQKHAATIATLGKPK